MHTPTPLPHDLAAWARLTVDMARELIPLPEPVPVTYHGTQLPAHGPAAVVGSCDCPTCTTIPLWQRPDVLVTPHGVMLTCVATSSYDLVTWTGR